VFDTWIYWAGQLFMWWMLHRLLEVENFLCECYTIVLYAWNMNILSWMNVYVDLTSFAERDKCLCECFFFSLTLHNMLEVKNCLCKCNIIVLHAWYMKILSGINVYVKVTSFAWGGELFIWMLHHCFCMLNRWKYWEGWMFMWLLHHCFAFLIDKNIEWDKCLCECYIIVLHA
jgi:hypothetical protein